MVYLYYLGPKIVEFQWCGLNIPVGARSMCCRLTNEFKHKKVLYQDTLHTLPVDQYMELSSIWYFVVFFVMSIQGHCSNGQQYRACIDSYFQLSQYVSDPDLHKVPLFYLSLLKTTDEAFQNLSEKTLLEHLDQLVLEQRLFELFSVFHGSGTHDEFRQIIEHLSISKTTFNRFINAHAQQYNPQKITKSSWKTITMPPFQKQYGSSGMLSDRILVFVTRFSSDTAKISNENIGFFLDFLIIEDFYSGFLAEALRPWDLHSSTLWKPEHYFLHYLSKQAMTAPAYTFYFYREILHILRSKGLYGLICAAKYFETCRALYMESCPWNASPIQIPRSRKKSFNRTTFEVLTKMIIQLDKLTTSFAMAGMGIFVSSLEANIHPLDMLSTDLQDYMIKRAYFVFRSTGIFCKP